MTSALKKILILGATGLLGARITQTLIEDGQHVICGVHNKKEIKEKYPEVEVIHCDFTKDTSPSDWYARLKDVAVIINCVGIFYHPNKKIIWNIHYETPKALYQAAQKAKVQRIIHISALGIERYETQYAKSKLATEQLLKTLDIPWIILKPSFIYGPSFRGGMLLIRHLSMIPFVTFLPGKGEQKFQPIAVDDLATAVSHLTHIDLPSSLTLAAVSKPQITLKEIMRQLRQCLGLKKSYFISIPLGFIKRIAKLGNYVPSVINSDAVLMLESGNCTSLKEAQRFQKIAKITPLSFTQGIKKIFSSKASIWYAKLSLLKPLLRLSLAFMWFVSAITSVLYAQDITLGWLKSAGIPTVLQPILLYGACLLNALIGLALLMDYKTKINCLIQIGVIIFYTLIISFKLPYLWWEPFGPIVKNIPILVAILMLYSMED